MALSTTQYGYIIDPMVPFTDDKGNTIKDGFVRVFVAGSSTPVVTYRNFDGAANQDLIELDNSGRTKTSVIGSKGFTYKVCVYDAFHSQESPILTVDKVSVIGANITAGAGATLVTGLDGLTTKPNGFVDASVVGTDGYVALDHTLVTDDLDTDAKVTAVEEDRYIPLLNEDVNDPDSKMTLGRLWKWVLGKIKSLPTTITAFRTGDVIPVDGPDGTAKMAKDDLLKETAENAAASGLVATPDQVDEKIEDALVYGYEDDTQQTETNALVDEGSVSGYKVAYDTYYGLLVLQSSAYQQVHCFEVERGKTYRVHFCLGNDSQYTPYGVITASRISNISGSRPIGQIIYGDNASPSLVVKTFTFKAEIDGFAYLNSSPSSTTFALWECVEVSVKTHLEEETARLDDFMAATDRLGGLVESRGRFYSISSIQNEWANTAHIEKFGSDPFGNDTFVMTGTGWTRISFPVSGHVAGESIGVMYYVDPAYIYKDYQATPISSLDVLKFTFVDASENELASILNYRTAINNGWNYVQTGQLSSRCTKVYLQVNGDANTLSYLLGSYVCGRKTKPVLMISYDGGPNQSTYNCGVYDLHESLGLPFCVAGIDTYAQTSVAADRCKELMRKGLMEWSVYTHEIGNATDFTTGKAALETKLNPVRNGTISTDMISVCCSHNANNTLTENILVSEGFKIFRCLGHRQNMLKDIAGLRNVNVCQMGFVQAGWDAAAEATEIANIKNYIDALISEGSWGGIMSHAVVMTSDITPADYGLSETYEVWSTILNYIKSKVDSGELVVMKISDLWRRGHDEV